MTAPWPIIPLGAVAVAAERGERPVPGTTYRQIGVRLWGEGAYEREPLDGAATRYGQLYRVEPGNIIVNKIWARNGSVAVVPPELGGCFGSGEFPMFVVDRERLDPRWFHWITKARWFWQACDEHARGTSGKNRIRPEKFLEISIPLPPLAEQRRIVAKIDQLAAKIAEARGLREAAASGAGCVIDRSFAQIVAESAAAHPSHALGELLNDAGYGTSTKCFSERLLGAVPVLRIPNVASECVNLANLKYATLAEREQNKLLLAPGDLLVVRTNGSADLVGRCAVVAQLPEPSAYASYLIRLRCDRKRVEPDYLQRVLRHLRADGQLFDFARTTAGQYNVSLGRLRAARIPLPGPPEQRRIVAYLDDLQANVDRLKALQVQTAAELDALLPAILDKAFKGDV